MDKRIKYSLQQKLSVVKSVTAGIDSYGSAARRIGSKLTTVRRWVNHYQQHGRAGLQLRQGSYSGKFKLEVIGYMLKNRLSLSETATIFGVPQDHTVGQWLKKYECSAGELLKETRGRKRSTMAKKSRKKISADPMQTKLASLQSEVEYLRAENAFLKKLDALIQEEKAASHPGKPPKPSKN